MEKRSPSRFFLNTSRLFYYDYKLTLFYFRLTERRTSSLLYEHTVPEEEEPVFEDNPQEVEAIFEDLITVLPINESKPITAAKFTTLVFAMRKLGVPALRDVWTQFYNCDDGADMQYSDKQCKKLQ